MTRYESDNTDLQQALKNSLEHSAEAHFLHRLHCVLIVLKGVCATTVAKWFNYSPSTVSRWVKQYNQFGIIGLKDTPRSGRPKKISSEQFNMLRQDIIVSPRNLGYAGLEWDAKCLQAHLENCYKISLGIRQCQRLIKQLKHKQEKIVESSDPDL